jgi:Fe-Mn family superoxide dismutase
MFTLPKLLYSYDALSPYIDGLTMEIHLTKHHQTYIDTLNKALIDYPELQVKTVEQLISNLDQIPQAIRSVVQNHGGGHSNHELFWQMMAPKSKVVSGVLLKQIVQRYGSLAEFQTQFETCAKTRFGSGWAWLVLKPNHELDIYSTANQDSPYSRQDVPLLGLDVWEHAYYLKYQNKRPDYIAAWWNVVNWEFVEQRYQSFIKK